MYKRNGERLEKRAGAGDGSSEMNRLSTLGVNNHNGWGGEKGGRDLRSLRHTRGPTVTCPIQHLAKRTDLSRRLSTAARTPARVTRWAQNTHDGFSQPIRYFLFNHIFCKRL